MPYKIRVTSTASKGKEFVPGLGLFVPNEWTDVSDEDAARYESMMGKTLEESGLEVKKATTPKKKESE